MYYKVEAPISLRERMERYSLAFCMVFTNGLAEPGKVLMYLKNNRITKKNLKKYIWGHCYLMSCKNTFTEQI